MATRTRTLQQLRDAVSDRADVAVAASGVRHTETKVDARINRAIQRWLNLVAECGDDTFLLTTRTATATSATKDAADWAPREYIAQPSGMLVLRGVTIWQGNIPNEMELADDMERSDFVNPLTANSVGLPIAYRLGGTNAAGAALIQIFPWADAVYTVDLRYLPAHTDLSTGSQTVDFLAGGEEWVANDAAMQTFLADGLAGHPNYGAMAAMNTQIEEDLRIMCARRSATRKRDAVGQRKWLRARATWRGL